MTRMLDRHSTFFQRVLADKWLEFRRNLVCVNVNNVYEWLLGRQANGEEIEYPDCVIPPWERSWYEYHHRNGGNVGILLIRYDHGHNAGDNHACNHNSSLKWTVEASIFMEGTRGTEGLMYIGSATILENADGRLIKITTDPAAEATKLLGDNVEESMYTLMAAALYGIDLAHLKNVQVLDEEIPFTKLNRIRKKRGQEPLFQFRTLAISPERKARVHGSAGEQQVVPKRLHLVRGHKREYFEDRKLFGKLAGKIWIPEHHRGKLQSGMVVKDYNVRPTNMRKGNQ